MTSTEKVFNSLPNKFTRQDILKEASTAGYSYSTASALAEKMLFESMIERIATGVYRKLS